MRLGPLECHPFDVPLGWLLDLYMYRQKKRGCRDMTRSNNGRPFISLRRSKDKRKERSVHAWADTSPTPLRPRTEHENISAVAIDMGLNGECTLLTRLPPEVRMMIWGYAVGEDVFCVITVPWKVTTAPYIDPSRFDLRSDSLMSRYHLAKNDPDGSTQQLSFPMVRNLAPQRTALLKTCRQIYHEAVDLMYFTNTFVFHDSPTLVDFSKSILPERMDAIRTLRLYWSAKLKPPYPHPWWRPREIRWRLMLERMKYHRARAQCWQAIASMRGLRNLAVHLEYLVDSFPDGPVQVPEKVLEPLWRLRGLDRLEVTLGLVEYDLYGNDEVRFEKLSEEVRKELLGTVRRPRESHHDRAEVPNTVTWSDVTSRDFAVLFSSS